MKHVFRILMGLALFSAVANAQANLGQTTLSSAITTTSQNVIQVASASLTVGPYSGIMANKPQWGLYIDNELVTVTGVNGTFLQISRGSQGTRATTHASGTVVYAAPLNYFSAFPRAGSCTSTNELILPVVDYTDAQIYNCVGGSWLLVVNGTANYPQNLITTSSYTNATTTFSNVSGISIPIHAARSVVLNCRITWQGSASTAGPKYQFTGPASPTAVTVGLTSVVTATTFITASATAFSSAVANTGTVTAATNFTDTLTLSVNNGANNGTIQLQAAANGAGTLTIAAGSYCQAQ